jgi:hypothetical protein
MKENTSRGTVYVLDDTDKDDITGLLYRLSDQLWDIFIRRKMVIDVAPKNQAPVIPLPIKNRSVDGLNDLDHIF